MNSYLMVTSASKPLTLCCKALLKDMMVFSGASYKVNDNEEKKKKVNITELYMVLAVAEFSILTNSIFS